MEFVDLHLLAKLEMDGSWVYIAFSSSKLVIIGH